VAGKKQDNASRQNLALAEPGAKPAAVMWLLCGFLLALPIGEWSLRQSVEMNRDRSWFAVVNAITLTGFTSTIATNTYATGGRVVVFGLTIVGMLFSMIVGGMAVARILRLPYGDGQIARSAMWVSGILVVGGAIPLIAAGDAPFEAFMLSASALGNSGHYFGRLPGLLGWRTQAVLMPMSVLGGLGLPVLMEMGDALRGRRRLSVHSRLVLKMTAGVYLVVFGACFLVQVVEEASSGAVRGMELIRAAGSSSVAAVNSRTAGFPLEYAQDMPRVMQWIVILAMVVGGSPGGTAGGVKTTTVAELYSGVVGALRGRPAGRAFAVAATWAGLYMLMAVLVLILLLALAPQVAADRLVFETISALSNVGLSHEVVMMVGAGLEVLTLAMLLGRLAPLGVLWWMARTTREAEVAVG